MKKHKHTAKHAAKHETAKPARTDAMKAARKAARAPRIGLRKFALEANPPIGFDRILRGDIDIFD
jgi:hypothetical protein